MVRVSSLECFRAKIASCVSFRSLGSLASVLPASFLTFHQSLLTPFRFLPPRALFSTGKLLHIDFGDCFESSMQREKFPERVPFRLTRMMIKAFEVSGIEGNFRATCNDVLRVLRTNKDSVMAMLEAFVYDPLINWRLLTTVDNLTDSVNLAEGDMPDSPPKKEMSREQALASVHGDAKEVLNERAVSVMRRLSDKLTGRDADVLDERDADSVPHQVQRLIQNATSPDNLSVMYIGWCAFW